ncbi:stonustoxin subunit beta-like [Periophthalmus magnuspinnatus]|uniref:stonustoxin subunit beta-like n=1 Tax=Periophthalmus magnuspinnatus TaxID=409849 RepID=UPI002436B334|nr:stonustoxin subunit beta-like [Periophthalmus magnuspinnatus]
MDQRETREDGAPPSKTTHPPRAHRPAPGASAVSFKSVRSMLRGIKFKREAAPDLEFAGAVRLTPGLRKYFCDLTLDPNTAHRKLKLSDNNKKVTLVWTEQPYPDHQDRFDFWAQILCSTGLTGRCYWEVQWSGDVYISVSYRGIRRKGACDDSGFGWNDQSWSLVCSKRGFSVWHNHKSTYLPQSWSSSSGTASVFVDCPAGSLSFYTVSSDQLTHLHTFNTTFTHTLLPGFSLLSSDSSVCVCAPTHSPSSV